MLQARSHAVRKPTARPQIPDARCEEPCPREDSARNPSARNRKAVSRVGAGDTQHDSLQATAGLTCPAPVHDRMFARLMHEKDQIVSHRPPVELEVSENQWHLIYSGPSCSQTPS